MRNEVQIFIFIQILKGPLTAVRTFFFPYYWAPGSPAVHTYVLKPMYELLTLA